MPIADRFISTAPGDAGLSGTLYARIQRENVTGVLGDYWNGTTKAWQATDPGNSDSVTVVEGPDGLYTATEPDGLAGHNGRVWVAFIEVGDTTPFAQGWETLVGGNTTIDEGGVSAGCRTRLPIPAALTVALTRRADGTVQATRRLTISPEDQAAIGVDTKDLFEGVFVAAAAQPTVDASGQLTLTALDPRDTLAAFQVGGSPVGGQSYRCESLLTMDNGDKVQAIWFIDCVDVS